MKKLSLLVMLAVLLMAGTVGAVDVPFTVTAPTFDFTVAGTAATAILTLAVGYLGYRVVAKLLGWGR